MGDNSEITNNKKSRRTFLLVIVFILLACNLFLLYKFFEDKKQITVTKEELFSTTELKNQLERQVKDYEIKTIEFIGKINEKDATLVAYRIEIEYQKAKILELIKSDKISRSKYEKAIEEIEKLKYYSTKYQDQIEELLLKNKELSTENVTLKKTIKKKNKNIDSLEDKTTHLTNKVSLGAKFSVGSLEVMGLMVKDGGRKKETMKGSKIEGLRITFTINDNVIADKGIYDVFIKIVNPKGETLYLEGYGSGKFDFQGEQSLYTVKSTIEFRNETGKIYSIYWSKGSNFEKGDYKAEIYTKGQLIGEQKFVIK